MKFVIAMDSFKGSLTSLQAGRAVEQGIAAALPEAECSVFAMADGGEGTMAALTEALDGRVETVALCGPLGQPIKSGYGEVRTAAGDRTAVVETAAICGLTMVAERERNPLLTTTRGLGEAIRHGLDAGIRRFIVGLGGSATNDGGMGMLAALGAEFRCATGERLFGRGEDLRRVDRVDLSGLDPRLEECVLIGASDVDNPLCGPDGATAVFGAQKGADPQLRRRLDDDLARYASLVEGELQRRAGDGPPAETNMARRAGAGAAGGLGFALLALGGRLESGARLVMEAIGLEEPIRRCDWVITGEGRSDSQTAFGKLPYQVAGLAEAAGKPCTLLSGSLGEDADRLEARFAGCFAAVSRPSGLQDCLEQAGPWLQAQARRIALLVRAAARRG
ncbi:glycerate kinase [Cohnella hongkongensis]|uniref:Glycerate kinase n=1 Tax=Cohnella hongkongensis TaxID=178337 RepID=A0ABV9FE76_9BACL